MARDEIRNEIRKYTNYIVFFFSERNYNSDISNSTKDQLQ